MTTINAAIIIPFRDRGRDPLRLANLDTVLKHWAGYDYPTLVIDDGRSGDEQFNRSAAYNAGTKAVDADVIVFAESDMIVPYHQVDQAIGLALEKPGLVVPFTEYRYLSAEDSAKVRDGALAFEFAPQSVMGGGTSVGAVNVLSRQTLNTTGGFDENFEGSWFDDNATEYAFRMCAGPTCWIIGSAWHLYHLPGWSGAHLTTADIRATRRNKSRYDRYLAATTPEEVRELVNEQPV